MVNLRALRAIIVAFAVFGFGFASAVAKTPHDGKFVLALQAADADAVTKALKLGVNVNELLEHPEYPSVSNTPLRWLLSLSDPEENKATLATQDSKRLNVAKILFANGAKLSDSQSEIFASIYNGHERVTRLLLSKGAKVTDKIYGYTLLQLAYRYERANIQDLLLSSGSHPIAKEDRLQIDIVRGAISLDPQLIEEALQAGGNINAPDPSGQTGLTALLEMPVLGLRGGVELLGRFLVEWRANPALGKSTNKPTFPIIQLVEMNSFREEDFELTAKVLEHLLLRGADVKAVNEFKETALHAASKRGNVPACRVLMKAGAKPSALDFQNRTPLSVAKNAATRAVLRENQ